MIFNNCLIKVSDNSNVSYVKCFNIRKELKSFIGVFLYMSIKSLKTEGRLLKGDVLKGIIVRERKNYHRYTGNYLKFDLNETILLNEKNEVFNAKILGLLPLELKRKKHLRLLSLSSHFV
jgi:large subunit ribosomal protein L14